MVDLASWLLACVCWGVAACLLFVSCVELTLLVFCPGNLEWVPLLGVLLLGTLCWCVLDSFGRVEVNGGKLASDIFSAVSEEVPVLVVPIGVTCAGFSCICSSGSRSWVFCTCVDLSLSGVSEVAGARLDPAEGVLVSAMCLSVFVFSVGRCGFSHVEPAGLSTGHVGAGEFHGLVLSLESLGCQRRCFQPCFFFQLPLPHCLHQLIHLVGVHVLLRVSWPEILSWRVMMGLCP